MDYGKEAENFLHAIRPLQKITMIQDLNLLSSGEMAALCYLYFQKNGVNAGELTAKFQFGSSRTAAILNGLERKGYVTRQTDPLDGRRVLVYITEDGKKVATRRQKEAAGHLAEFLELLGPDDSRQLLEILYRAIEKKKSDGQRTETGRKGV